MERASSALKMLEQRLETAGKRRADREANRLMQMKERLTAISPLAVLNRGFALTTTRDGHVIPSAAEAQTHSQMTLRFADGQVAVIREERERI